MRQATVTNWQWHGGFMQMSVGHCCPRCGSCNCSADFCLQPSLLLRSTLWTVLSIFGFDAARMKSFSTNDGHYGSGDIYVRFWWYCQNLMVNLDLKNVVETNMPFWSTAFLEYLTWISKLFLSQSALQKPSHWVPISTEHPSHLNLKAWIWKLKLQVTSWNVKVPMTDS